MTSRHEGRRHFGFKRPPAPAASADEGVAMARQRDTRIQMPFQANDRVQLVPERIDATARDCLGTAHLAATLVVLSCTTTGRVLVRTPGGPLWLAADQLRRVRGR